MKINQDILLPQSDQERAFEIKDALEAATVQLIASGLDSSGGWIFSSEGALYVTEGRCRLSSCFNRIDGE